MTIRTVKRAFFYIMPLALSLPFVTACVDGWKTKSIQCKSFVIGYNELQAIELVFAGYDGSAFIIRGHGPSSYTVFSSGTEQRRYEELCEKHHDTGFNQTRVFTYRNGELLDPFIGCFQTECDFFSIEVYSDKDFDPEHPAGSSLGDVVRFMSVSAYPHILSGYKDYYNVSEADLSDAYRTVNQMCSLVRLEDDDNVYYPIDKFVNELSPSDLILLGKVNFYGIGFLHFEKKPEKPAVHAITVVLHADTGKSFTASTTVSF